MLRRLLPPLLPAVLALAVAVPVTWAVATSQAGPAPEPALTGPRDRQQLRAELLAQLPGGDVPGAVLLEVRSSIELAASFPPGRYRLHLICGLLRRQGQPEEMSLFLDALDHTWRVALPCPSTPLTMDDQLDFTGRPAGGLAVVPEFVNDRPASFLLLLRLVPVT